MRKPRAHSLPARTLALALAWMAICGPANAQDPEPPPPPVPDTPEPQPEVDQDAIDLARRRRAADRGEVLPTLAPNGWEVHVPARSYSSWTIQWAGDGAAEVLQRAIVKASSAGIAAHKGHKHDGYQLREVLIEPLEGALPLWGIRAYEVRDWVLENVEIRGMGGKPGKPEGHAFYGNVAGDLTFLGCTFHDNKGQAVQVVARPNAGTAPAKGQLLIRDCVFAENGFDSDRAGFQISIFGPGSEYDVTIENTRLLALAMADFPYGGQVWNSRGGVCIAPVRGKQHLPAWFDEANPPFTNGHVKLDGLVVRMKRPSQPMALFRGIRKLEVRNSEFQGGGTIVIDSPGTAGRDCGEVIWEGNRGDALVFYQGKELGPVTGTYRLGRPEPDPAQAQPGLPRTGEENSGEARGTGEKDR